MEILTGHCSTGRNYQDILPGRAADSPQSQTTRHHQWYCEIYPLEGQTLHSEKEQHQELLSTSFWRISSLFCECPTSILTFYSTGAEPLPSGQDLPISGNYSQLSHSSDPNRSGNSPALTALGTVSLMSLSLFWFFFFPATGIAAKHQMKLSNNLYNIICVQSFASCNKDTISH